MAAKTLTIDNSSVKSIEDVVGYLKANYEQFNVPDVFDVSSESSMKIISINLVGNVWLVKYLDFNDEAFLLPPGN
ncbi:MAG: hypothetical protein WBB95_02985 [Pseudomonas sp.]|uniref:hypothetical protein n=1 Tax=Pseudomonas sp. TaxID=306 RepID=UPI003C760707